MPAGCPAIHRPENVEIACHASKAVRQGRQVVVEAVVSAPAGRVAVAGAARVQPSANWQIACGHCGNSRRRTGAR